MDIIEDYVNNVKYYMFIENDKINGCGQCECISEDVRSVEVSQEVYNTYVEDDLTYVWDPVNEEVIPNPNYAQEQAIRHRQELDQLTLTPADVERALYKAKGMDFDDLKAFIAQQIPTIDVKGLAIEFRAKDFYRGAEANGVRLFDTIGQLLGYNVPEDMDYLFQHKELPSNSEE